MDDKVRRGQNAALLLENELLHEVLSGLEAHYLKAMRSAKTPDAILDAHRLLGVLDSFKADLKSMVLTGNLTDRRMKELEGRKGFWG